MTEIPIESIDRNPDQPRRRFDETALATLADSIVRHGLLQPLLVRPRDGGFELVAGERRWLAARRAGRTTVPVQIRDVPDELLLETALVENIQREDLSPLEEAEAFRRLAEEDGLTHQGIADRVGRDRATVTNTLRLLTLPEAVQDLLETGRVSSGHARALLALKRAEEMTLLAHEIADRGLSVRQAESRVRALLGGGSAAARSRARGRGHSDAPGAAAEHMAADASLMAQIRAVREALTSKLATKVRIEREGDGHGAIVIEFYSDADLDRVTALLL